MTFFEMLVWLKEVIILWGAWLVIYTYFWEEE